MFGSGQRRAFVPDPDVRAGRVRTSPRRRTPAGRQLGWREL